MSDNFFNPSTVIARAQHGILVHSQAIRRIEERYPKKMHATARDALTEHRRQVNTWWRFIGYSKIIWC
jgi:hypothetical protein